MIHPPQLDPPVTWAELDVAAQGAQHAHDHEDPQRPRPESRVPS